MSAVRYVQARSAGITSAAPGPARPDVTLAHRYLKRSLDLVVAVCLAVVAFPLLVAISIAIVLDGGWPVFYRQERVGARARRCGGRFIWEERRFRILKFRTMVPGADASPVHEQFVKQFVAGNVATPDDRPSQFKLREDCRVTRVGRVLRRTSLDELPQLFNVLRGTMSLVGPRPVPTYEVVLYTPVERERLAALPGMTGPWQVCGRARVSFDEMVRMDIEYVRTHSLRTDLRLLLRTVPAVLSMRGAE